MSEQKSVKDLPACPVETTLTLIGDKWKVLILRDLLPGTKRFGELKKSIGSVSQKVLTAQLRDMEENGLVNQIFVFFSYLLEVGNAVGYTLEIRAHDATLLYSSANITKRSGTGKETRYFIFDYLLSGVDPSKPA